MKYGDYIRTTYASGEMIMGRIVDDTRKSGWIAVEFDPPFTGHVCGGLIPSGRGYWIPKIYAKVVPGAESPIIDYIRSELGDV